MAYKSAVDKELTYWLHLVIKPSNIGSGNGLVPEGTKPYQSQCWLITKDEQ